MKRDTYHHLLAPRGLYRPAYEHDSCGTGFIARISGEASHDIVEMAVQAVINLTHRGAVSADAMTGDGAGVQTQIPRKLLAREAQALGLSLPNPNDLAVAMVFLPGHDQSAQNRSIDIIEESIAHYRLTRC